MKNQTVLGSDRFLFASESMSSEKIRLVFFFWPEPALDLQLNIIPAKKSQWNGKLILLTARPLESPHGTLKGV